MTKNHWHNLQLLCLAVVIGWILLYACSPKKTEPTTQQHAASPDGEKLSRLHCGSCHAYPDPGLLDKRTWKEQVLPNMAHRFGIYADRSRDTLIEQGIGGRMVEQAGIFPVSQTLPDDHWQKIVQYYLNHALDSIPRVSPPVIEEDIRAFKPVFPSITIERAAVTALTYDPLEARIYMADCSLETHSSVTVLSPTFEAIVQLGLPQPVSKMVKRPEGLYLLQIGHLIPSDEPAGSLLRAVKDQSGENYKGYSQVLKGLKRPVDMLFVDVENDGDGDIVVCEFGNHTGAVSLFINDGKNRYTPKTLLAAPGAIKVLSSDLNNDSLPDLMVLMAQGDEGIDIYYNLGNGNFRRERILRFSPIYGSMGIELVDFNQDGHLDIVYVNGDNADYSAVLKPYHGLRLFLNDGKNRFDEAFFFPLHGAYQSVARDFDQDGDIDIGVISFFADFQKAPENGFVFLENVTDGSEPKFKASTFPGSEKGRWITMTSGDFDQDGDTDLLMGSFVAMDIPGDTDNSIREKIIKEQTTLVLLRNDHR